RPPPPPALYRKARASRGPPRAGRRSLRARSTSRASSARACRGRTRAPRRSRRRSARSSAPARSFGRREPPVERLPVVPWGSAPDEHRSLVGILDDLRRVVIGGDHDADGAVGAVDQLMGAGAPARELHRSALGQLALTV